MDYGSIWCSYRGSVVRGGRLGIFLVAVLSVFGHRAAVYSRGERLVASRARGGCTAMVGSFGATPRPGFSRDVSRLRASVPWNGGAGRGRIPRAGVCVREREGTRAQVLVASVVRQTGGVTMRRPPHAALLVQTRPSAYRKTNLLRELVEAGADVLCLQEIQSDAYVQHFQPHLSEKGYDGLYKAKTREGAMGKVGFHDGFPRWCARACLYPGAWSRTRVPRRATGREGFRARARRYMIRGLTPSRAGGAVAEWSAASASLLRPRGLAAVRRNSWFVWAVARRGFVAGCCGPGHPR